ncbi:MAG: protease modulator HflC [Gemmataceae bacterium]|nr:protease modulator HflC [Gemmataceae bacterium]MCS7270330.1 protease modulator HflC [Gemmataceae bacterium]MDW8243166.1 protease modulator HflC [Thermogemmata sp.]
MGRWLLIVLLLGVVLAVGRSCLFTVEPGEYVLVTRFGQMRTVLDGVQDAGLHIKAPWPIDSLQRLDRRLQVLDLPTVESLTRDPSSGAVDKTLTVEAVVVWRIPDGAAADRFFRTLRTPEQARAILAPLLNGRLAAAVSAVPLDEWIGPIDTQLATAALTGWLATLADSGQFAYHDRLALQRRSERLRQRWLTGNGGDVSRQVLESYGVELCDVRLRRFAYPEAVRNSIAERIRSERARKAADYESQGRQQAAAIAAEAERQARAIESEAQARKTLIEGQAQAEVARLRAEAYAQDPEFYLFLENLRAFQAAIAETKDLLLLSTRHPLLRPLAGPPGSPETLPNAAGPTPATTTAGPGAEASPATPPRTARPETMPPPRQ